MPQEIRVRAKSIWASRAAKKAPINRAYTGSLAPQFIMGTVSMVARRALGSRKVRAAITPGTAQPPLMPPLTIMAITLLPCRPKFLSTRSSR